MRGTLVLNASYEPLGVVPIRRAAVLVVTGRAVTVDEAPDQLRAASLVMAAPSVVRLTRFVKVPYRRRVALTRANVLARDGGRCVYCGDRAFTIDHVIPRSRGGRHEWGNVVAACGAGRGSRNCNGRKGNRLLSELGWTLPFTPSEPAGGATWMAAILAGTDPAWMTWLTTAAAAA